MTYWQMSLDRFAAWCMVLSALILAATAITADGDAWRAYYAAAAAWFAWVNADKSRKLWSR